jgi:hypothetical protein
MHALIFGIKANLTRGMSALMMRSTKMVILGLLEVLEEPYWPFAAAVWPQKLPLLLGQYSGCLHRL